MLVPLATLATTALPLATAVVLCSKDRKTVHAKNNQKSSKSNKSKRSGSSKSKKGGASSKSHRSSKSGKSKKPRSQSKSGHSSKSARAKKSDRSKRSGSKSERSQKSARAAADKSKKSSKSSKSKKAPGQKLAKDAEKKLEKSGKSGSRKRREAANKAAASVAQNLQAKNNKSNWDPQPEGTVSKSKVVRDVSNREQKSAKDVKSLVEEVNEIKHCKTMLVQPSKLQYQSLGGLHSLEIKNNSSQRKAYKLKCSDNALYRVNPVYGFAEPNSVVKIDVLRSNGDTKMDKLVVLTAAAEKSETDARRVFGHNVEREMMVVPLQVV